MNKRGKFIVFEGIDGSGKSTQMKLLAQKLEEKGIKTRLTLEPTYGLVGGTLHHILSGKIKADPKVTAALFVADRLDHLTNAEDGVLKSLENGETVICDRYYFSSYAYQSTEVGEWVVEANKLSAGHARCLVPVQDYDTQVRLALAASDNKMIVRDLEKAVKNILKHFCGK